MDTLLQEMRGIEVGAATNMIRGAPNVSQLATANDWEEEFLHESKRAKGKNVLEWTKEFLEENPELQGPDDPVQPVLRNYDERWAEEYLSEEVPVLRELEDAADEAFGKRIVSDCTCLSTLHQKYVQPHKPCNGTSKTGLNI
jgi:hypothetical protein